MLSNTGDTANAQWSAVLVEGKIDAENASQEALDSVNADLRKRTVKFEQEVDTLDRKVVSLTKDNKSFDKELKKTKADLDAVRGRQVVVIRCEGGAEASS